jgi:hypothetical protein
MHIAPAQMAAAQAAYDNAAPAEQHPHDPRTEQDDDTPDLEAAALDGAQAFSLAVQAGADILLPERGGERAKLTEYLVGDVPADAARALLLACQQAVHPSGNTAECAALLMGFVDLMASRYGRMNAEAWA